MPIYTKDDIVALAGPRSYDRGIDYIDQVSDLVADDAGVTATVAGTTLYEVCLDVGEGLDGDCDCPYGQEGNFCKHCVAVALVYLYHAEHGTLVPVTGEQPPSLPDYLTSLRHDTLVELLLTAAGDHPDLRKRLELRAATDTGRPADADHIHAQIDRLLYVDGYVHYREATGYASRVEEVTGRLAELHRAGHGAEVVELVRHALATAAEMYSAVDDSSGYVGAALEELAGLHAQICAQLRPDPLELADWLRDFRTAGPDWPELVLADYVDVLGRAGMDRYGRELAALWRAGTADDDRSHRRLRLTRLMEEWVTECGDHDLLVRILSEPGPHGVPYRRIADVLTEAGRHAEALEWAERGLTEPGARVDDSLVEFVVARYAEAGRSTDVLTVRKARFARASDLPAYQLMRDAALAVDCWPATRQWALDLLRGYDDGSSPPSPHPVTGPGSVLVDILLWEQAAEEAWTAAQRCGANDAQWLRLARAREATHADDAVAVYQRQLERYVESRNTDGYDRAAELVVRVKALYAGLGRADRFAEYLAGLRRAHRPKRNFMAALDRRGL